MSDLISRLQALTEPSREIDAEIFERSGKIDEDHCRSWCSMDGRTDLTRKQFIKAWAPRYTESLDAALTLVPKDRFYAVCLVRDGGMAIIDADDEFIGDKLHGPGSYGAATPAIALLIAIMKAKEGEA